MSDPRQEFATDVVRQLRAAGFVALWAGGCVRDLLMGRTPGDYDVASNATPEEVRRVFGPKRTIPVGESFGVIIVRGPRSAGHVEVATFRREGPYSDGRRPDHVTFATPEEDAQRRDFTINGMFFDPVDGRVLDYVGGEQDLRLRMLKAIGNPQDRMREDKLRMLRAIRFAAVLEFELDEATERAIREMRDDVRQVSAERIAQELQKMLAHRHRRRAVELAQRTGLLSVIFPQLTEGGHPPSDPDGSATLAALDALDEPSFEIALAILLRHLPAARVGRQKAEPGPHSVDSICDRLRLSNDQKDLIVWLVAGQTSLEHVERAEPWVWKRFLQHPWASRMLKYQSVVRQATGEDLTAIHYLTDLQNRLTPEEIDPPPLVTGETLIQLGLKPGPGFRELLDRVRNAQLNGEIATLAEAKNFIAGNANPANSGREG